MKLLVELDGQQVPLSECDWVLRTPCGCIESLVVTVMAGQTLATPTDAWTYLYRDEYRRKPERDRKIRKDQDAGWRLELMRRFDAVAEFQKPCTHGTMS